MRKTFEFDAFGRMYRTKQFAAIQGLHILEKKDELEPSDVLAATDALGYDDEWYPLSDPANIDAYVTDAADVLPPVAILRGLIRRVNDVNFGFIQSWKQTKVPSRFRSDAASVTSDHIDPMIQTLVQENLATYRELEEYYSLQDAFKMFDILVVKGVNSALSHEQMEREAKSKRK